MSRRKPTPNAAEDKTYLLVNLIDRELHSICPEESMSRYLGDDYLTGCRFEDGALVLSIKTKKGPRELVLKPVAWRAQN
jgi:hypothetical protein